MKTDPTQPVVWFDVMAPCCIFLLEKMRSVLGQGKVHWIITAREHAETTKMLKARRIPFTLVGGHRPSSFFSKIESIAARVNRLVLELPAFDFSLSVANLVAVMVSKVRGRPAIAVVDNDLVESPSATMSEKAAAWVHAQTEYLFLPSSYDAVPLMKRRRIAVPPFVFDGFKEDLYLAGFKPIERSGLGVPFDEYVCVRPEALHSIYVKNKVTIVPRLLRALTTAGMNVVYLPRNRHEQSWAADLNVFVPDSPLDGPSLAWYSSGVLSGSGTFTREAAVLGRPSVSFFPGVPLGVDRRLIQMGFLYHSRNPEEIVQYLQKSQTGHRARSSIEAETVFREFSATLRGILNEDLK